MANWIKGAISKPGALHKEMGVPMDKKIPMDKMREAAHAKGKLGQRARLAMAMRGFGAKPKKGK